MKPAVYIFTGLIIIAILMLIVRNQRTRYEKELTAYHHTHKTNMWFVGYRQIGILFALLSFPFFMNRIGINIVPIFFGSIMTFLFTASIFALIEIRRARKEFIRTKQK